MSEFKNDELNLNDAPEVIEEVEQDTEIIEVIEEVAEEVAEETPAPKVKKAKRNKIARAINMRRLRYGSTSTALTAVVIAAIVLLNVIVGIFADKFPLTLDLSADKVFTLSQESVDIAKEITKDMEVVIFEDESEFTNPTVGAQNGVPELDKTIKEFYLALQQYRTHSDNKLSFTFIDANQQPAKFAKYEKYGVSAGNILFIAGERYKVCSLDDLYDYGYTSDYSSYTFSSKVEKTMAANVHSLSADTDRIVQVLTGHGEDTDAISGLKELYELNGYTFKELAITGSAAFDKDAEVILIAAPENDYSDAEIKRIQEWVYNDGNYGRHLMVFTHPTASCPNLYEFLNVEYKVRVTDELLLESDYNRMYQYNQYYAMADVAETDLIKDSVGTANILMPISRRIICDLPDKDPEATDWNYRYVISSYPDSAQLIKLADINDENAANKVVSAPAGDYPLTSMVVSVYDGYNNNTSANVFGTVTVSGCPAMAYSSYVKSSTFSNEEVLLETLNGVTGNESDITISNKEMKADTISFSGGTALILGLVVFTIGLPVIVLIICLVVFLRRKNL